jgi:selenocysteine-specific elongation factor
LKFEQKKFNQVIDEMVAEDFLSYEDDVVALADHAVEFSEEDKKNAAGIINEFEKAPYTPPSLKDLSEEYNADLVDAMCGKGMLVKLTDDIAFTPAIYRKVIADTRDFLKKEGKITLAQFRDNFNTSRKYALALLEHMDAIGITLREDDFRVLK